MRIIIISTVAVLLMGCGRKETSDTTQQPAPAQPPPAASTLPTTTAPSLNVQLAPTQGNTASGQLTVMAEAGGVRLVGTVSGLTPNADHGIHIHEKGDCSAPDASSAGEHFSPLDKPHGAPGTASHVGDLGNITANDQGVAQLDVRAMQATLRDAGQTDIAGKAIIVHAKPDDLQTQPSGDSGDRIACGVIPE